MVAATPDLCHLRHSVDMELESAILNFKRQAQTSPDQGTFQATEICLEPWKTEALIFSSLGHRDRLVFRGTGIHFMSCARKRCFARSLLLVVGYREITRQWPQQEKRGDALTPPSLGHSDRLIFRGTGKKCCARSLSPLFTPHSRSNTISHSIII